MSLLRRACFAVLSVIWIILWTLHFTPYNQVEGNTCALTTINGYDVNTRLATLKQIEELDFPTAMVHSSEKLEVTLCPNNGSLKLVLNTNATKDGKMQLCYEMHAISDGRHLKTDCFQMVLPSKLVPVTVSCWFPMSHFQSQPIINAWAISHDLTGSRQHVGYLNTALIDPNNPCENACEVTTLAIPDMVSCNNTAYINHENEIRIKRISLIQQDVLKDDINILKKTEGGLQYFLNCSYQGDANIQVLYIVRGQFCLKYQPVQVLCSECENGKGDKDEKDEGEAFGTFVMYGVTCFVTTTLIIIMIIGVVQNKDRIMKFFRRSSGDLDPESYPMNPHNRQRVTFENGPPQTISGTSKTSYRKRGDSMSSGTSGASNNPVTSKQNRNKHKLQRSATMALLEITDPLYRKKILFMPSVWDHFSRDVTNLLKQLFTVGAGVTAQCCFDRDVYQQYMTGDKRRWIQALLGDRDKIVIFLCFTNLGTGKESSDEIDIVEDVLSHLVSTNNMAHLLCKVIYLHLTDSDGANVEQNHHGESYRINNSDAFATFLNETILHCGLRPDEALPLARKLFRSATTDDFLSFIGIGEHKPWSDEDRYKRQSMRTQISAPEQL